MTTRPALGEAPNHRFSGTMTGMSQLLECPGCARHVRIEDGRCPFCDRPSTTFAPVRMLALVLPLAVMACSGGEGKAKPDAKPTADAKAKPADDAKAKPADDPKAKPTDDAKAKPEPSGPADDGAMADEGGDGAGDGREMATKYGGPPVIDEPRPKPKPEDRPARKYGAPPPPDGGKPKPSEDPFK